MRTTSLTILVLFQFIALCSVFSQEAIDSNSDFPVLKGSYLGQKPPGMTPEIFAQEIFSNKFVIGLCIMPGGEELYFSQFEESVLKIKYMQIENGQWRQPQTAPFSREFRNWDLNISPDGKRIYFSSNRPLIKGGEPKKDSDIWFTERIDGIWSEPQNIGMPVNTDKAEVHPTIAENGNLYFFGRDSIAHIYFAKYDNGIYLKPEKLGNEINSEIAGSLDPFVAPDESYLIFHSNRNEGFGKMDLYISFKDRENNCWTKAINMGKIINSKNQDMGPRVSLDGKYFFFTSSDGDNPKKDGFYWIDSKFIDYLKPAKLK